MSDPYKMAGVSRWIYQILRQHQVDEIPYSIITHEENENILYISMPSGKGVDSFKITISDNSIGGEDA